MVSTLLVTDLITGKNMECHFSFEINAPVGLNNLHKDFEQTDLNLFIWKSGYNGKNILRSDPEGIISLDMDSSDTDLMFGSGRINSDYKQAKQIIMKISAILKRHGYKHKISVDNELSNDTYKLSF